MLKSPDYGLFFQPVAQKKDGTQDWFLFCRLSSRLTILIPILLCFCITHRGLAPRQKTLNTGLLKNSLN